jgi:hypothetical protein
LRERGCTTYLLQTTCRICGGWIFLEYITPSRACDPDYQQSSREAITIHTSRDIVTTADLEEGGGANYRPIGPGRRCVCRSRSPKQSPENHLRRWTNYIPDMERLLNIRQGMGYESKRGFEQRIRLGAEEKKERHLMADT